MPVLLGQIGGGGAKEFLARACGVTGPLLLEGWYKDMAMREVHRIYLNHLWAGMACFCLVLARAGRFHLIEETILLHACKLPKRYRSLDDLTLDLPHEPFRCVLQGVLYAKDGRITIQGKWKKGEKTLFF